MRIVKNVEEGRITLIPSDDAERDVLGSLATELSATDQTVRYDSRSVDDQERTISLNFNRPNGDRFTLVPTDEDDRQALGGLRDALFMGSGQLIFRGSSNTDPLSVYFTLRMCLVCGRDIIKMGEVEWRTCTECKAKCEHDYIKGYVHGGEAGDLAQGHYCSKCGLGKPNEEVKPLVGIFILDDEPIQIA